MFEAIIHLAVPRTIEEQEYARSGRILQPGPVSPKRPGPQGCDDLGDLLSPCRGRVTAPPPATGGNHPNLDERSLYFAHWTAADWKRLNEQYRQDAERLRQEIQTVRARHCGHPQKEE